jgi:hypothetical protein
MCLNEVSNVPLTGLDQTGGFLKWFSFGCGCADSGRTRIPFGNDKQQTEVS